MYVAGWFVWEVDTEILGAGWLLGHPVGSPHREAGASAVPSTGFSSALRELLLLF